MVGRSKEKRGEKRGHVGKASPRRIVGFSLRPGEIDNNLLLHNFRLVIGSCGMWHTANRYQGYKSLSHIKLTDHTYKLDIADRLIALTPDSKSIHGQTRLKAARRVDSTRLASIA